MSKSAKSGLGSIKRDFSSSDVAPRSSQEIYWPPTQPTKTVVQAPPPRKLTGSEARLKAIQDALSSMPSTKPPPPLTSSSTVNKRTNPEPESAQPLQKRARQLPPDWHDSLSGPSFTPSSSHSKSSSQRTKEGNKLLSNSGSAQKPTSKAKLATVFLSQEQTQILKLVQDGDSVFYTGSAGTGKSVLLKEIIKTMRKNHPKSSDAVAVTASTGIAACNIGGVTIHSFAGIGLGIEPAKDLVTKIKKNKKAASRWMRTKVLIIDEVSMVDGELFDKLADIGELMYKNGKPFGGIQVIVTGDFFQLPPVTKGSNSMKFAFEAEKWPLVIKHTFNLTKVFRQSDQKFVDILNEMRFGTLTPDSIKIFKSLSRAIDYEDGIGPTELFPRREDVERSNSTRMFSLKTQEEVFTSTDGGTIQDPTQREKMLANFMAPRKLVLRIDAQVMLIKNVDETLVNGSMGRIVRFVDHTVYGTGDDLEHNGEQGVVGAAAMTTGVGVGKGKTTKGDGKKYPVVEFILPNAGTRRMLVMPEVWKVELPSGEVQVSRTQLPLILSWAMSIHKSQGQTLERVKVDLGKVFEKGQAYVALSRATSLQGLQVLNFDASKVQAHPKVIAWTKTLSTITDNSGE